MKREDRVRTQKDTVGFNPFTLWRELEIWTFWSATKLIEKLDAWCTYSVVVVFCWHSRCRRRPSFVRSLKNKIFSWERVCYKFCVHELKRSFRENKTCLNGILLASFNQRIQSNSNFQTSHGADCHPPHPKKILLIKYLTIIPRTQMGSESIAIGSEAMRVI